MNSITISLPNNTSRTPLLGDLFKNKAGDQFYILGQVAYGSYICVSLSDGIRYKNCCNSPIEAVEGLEFLGENLKIHISNRKLP